MESWCFPFGEIAHYFSESLYENHQNNCTQYKTTKTTFPKKSKAVFISIRYRKTSQTQYVKSQSTERSVRGKLAQPKRDSAIEQKTRIVPSRETSGSSQNIFFSYNQRKMQSRARTDIFGTYSTSFGKVGVFLSVRSPIIFRTVCTKLIKTIAHNPKRRRPSFRKNQKLFFPSIRYRKTSQTQDVKSQSSEHSARKIPQPKPDSAFEQRTRIVSFREISGISQTIFLFTTKEKSRAELKQTFLERIQRHFGKLMFCFRWDRPLFFGKFVRKSSKQLHTIQNDEDHVSEKIKSCFYKYSISQDISNAGCREPKYQT